MMTVAAIVSLRNLPLTAEYGLSAIFFLILAAIIFFIPIALVIAELAVALPKSGGCYTWVSEAFGKNVGFAALWFAWIESIGWFPAILAFTASMLAHSLAPFFPWLESSDTFLLIMILVIFWVSTISNFFGIKISGWISSMGVILGTIIPGVLIITLGISWFFLDHPRYIDFSFNNLIPRFDLSNLVIFSGILLGLAGVELAAFHIKDAENPQKTYPKAVLIASIIILTIYILGTLGIAIVVPQEDINLVSGLIQALKIFFEAFGMNWIVPLLASFLLLGSLAGINTWTIGPIKGLLIPAEDGFMPKILRKTNKYEAPIALLILQGIVGSVLSLLFLYFEGNIAFWILTAISAQFTFLQYGLVLAAAVKLRYSKPNLKRSYKVPFIWLTAGICFISCLFSFFIVFVPPEQLAINNSLEYQLILLTAIILFSLPILGFVKYRKNNLNINLIKS